MARHRTYPVVFKRQLALEFLSGHETLNSLARRHDISRNLIRIWVEKHEQGHFDDETEATELLVEYEAKIAALERMVGRQALEIELLKKGLSNSRPPRGATSSVITGPPASASPKDAG